MKLVEKHQEYGLMFAKFGKEQIREDELYKEAKQFVCAFYVKPKYTVVNKLQYDSFLKMPRQWWRLRHLLWHKYESATTMSVISSNAC